MRKSREEAARTRERIIEAAADEFRRNGIETTGLAELMAAAGLTHGGFYKHFNSKDQLVAEASEYAIDSLAKWFIAMPSPEGKGGALQTLATVYLSASHRDNPSRGCPFAALGSELVRADENTRVVATAGLLKIIDLIAQQYRDIRPDVAKQRALVAFSTLVGALTLARLVTDPKLSNLVLREAARSVVASKPASQ
jgi:TetR/AcrR family transcriptional regulator, transcriptional repressor for nem operon